MKIKPEEEIALLNEDIEDMKIQVNSLKGQLEEAKRLLIFCYGECHSYGGAEVIRQKLKPYFQNVQA